MQLPRLARGALALVVLGAALAAPRPARAQMTAKSGPITVTLWAPEGVAKFKGILAFTSVGVGVGWGTSADFRALATKLQAAIVSIKGENPFGDATYPTRCARGEFKVLLDAITELGKVSSHPELANAPIVGSGHSHGGDYWNYFNACYPDRMALIFCKSSGGVQYRGQALRTPMVWEVGTNDLHDSRGHFRAQMLAHRSKGSAITLVLGPGETHGSFGAGPRALVLDIIEAMFKLRVPAESDASKGPVVLNDIDEASGAYWLGDNVTREISAFPGSPDKGMLTKTSFLPSETVAQKWKMIVPALSASEKIDDGFCSGCYKQLADEPPLRPLNAGPAPPPASGGSEADAGASDSGSQSPPTVAQDAGSSTTVTLPQGPPSTTPVTPPPGRDAAAPRPTTPPPDDPDPTTVTRGSSAGGCSVVERPRPAPFTLVLTALAIALLGSRLRRRS
jgi:hypothetical protein